MQSSPFVKFVAYKFRWCPKQERCTQINMLTAERILDPLSVVMQPCWGSLSPHDFSALRQVFYLCVIQRFKAFTSNFPGLINVVNSVGITSVSGP